MGQGVCKVDGALLGGWMGVKDGQVGVGTCGAVGIFLQSGSDPRAELSDLPFVLKPIVQQKDRSPVFLMTNHTTDRLGKSVKGKRSMRGKGKCEKKMDE